MADTNSLSTEKDASNEPNVVEVHAAVTSSANATQFQRLWHARLGHPSKTVMVQLARRLDIDIQDCHALRDCNLGKHSCITCAQAKGCKLPATTKARQSKFGKPHPHELLETIHVDTCGPITPASYPGGYKYFQLVVDAKSRFITPIFLKKKSESIPKLQDYRKQVQRATGRKIISIKTDNGTEFVSNAGRKFFSQKGIKHIRSTVYRPQQNGLVERHIQTIVNKAKAFMYTSGAPAYLWHLAITWATYIHNRLPSSVLPEDKSPYEVWNGFPPSFKCAWVWGCDAIVHIPKEQRKGKLDKSATKAAFVGLDGDDSGIYLCWDPRNRRIIRSSDVRLDESSFTVISKSSGYEPNRIGYTTPLDAKESSVTRKVTWSIEAEETPESEIHDYPSSPSSYSSDSSDDSDSDDNRQQPQPRNRNLQSTVPVPQTRPGITHQPGDNFGRNALGHRSSGRINAGVNSRIHGCAAHAYKTIVSENHDEIYLSKETYLHACLAEIVTQENTPYLSDHDNAEFYTYKQAVNHKDHHAQWDSAIKDELDSLTINEVWEPCELPPGRKAVGSRWVFRHKLNPNGSIARFKARMVAKGYTQKKHIDYNETYAPVVKFPSIRLFFTIAAEQHWDVHQLDAKTAFLCSPIDADIYIQIPEGYELPSGLSLKRPVLKLKKGLYGLKQSPLLWYALLSEYLISNGFTMSEYDHSVFAKEGIMVAIYVDDMLVSGINDEVITNFKNVMKQRFEMTDVGPATYFLNIHVTTERDENGKAVSYTLSQEHYLKRVLDQHGMLACADVPTPLDKMHTKRNPETEEAANGGQYRSIVGQVMYIYLATRPDIGFAISHLSQFCSDPTKTHMAALKRLLRYLKGTINIGLVLGGSSNRSMFDKIKKAYGDISPIFGFSDSDWARDQDDRRSVGAYEFFVYGSLVSWTAKKQLFVATSTMESEYVAASHGAKEAIWLRAFIDELNTRCQLGLDEMTGTYHVNYRNDSVHLDRDRSLVSYFEGSRLKPVTIFADSQAAIRVAYAAENHKLAKHIDISYHFLRQRVRLGYVRMTYINTCDNLADYLTKPLTPEKFKRCRDLSSLKAVPQPTLKKEQEVQPKKEKEKKKVGDAKARTVVSDTDQN